MKPLYYKITVGRYGGRKHILRYFLMDKRGILAINVTRPQLSMIRQISFENVYGSRLELPIEVKEAEFNKVLNQIKKKLGV